MRSLGAIVLAGVIGMTAPAFGQHLRIGLAEDPDILDPTLARTFVGRIVFSSMCDKLIEFQSSELKDLREAVAGEYSFRVTGHRLIISGICSDCSSKRHRRISPLDLI